MLSSYKEVIQYVLGVRQARIAVLSRRALECTREITLSQTETVDLIVVPSGSPGSSAIGPLAKLGVPVAYAYGADERNENARAIANAIASGSSVCLLDEGRRLEFMGIEYCGVQENRVGPSNRAAGTCRKSKYARNVPVSNECAVSPANNAEQFRLSDGIEDAPYARIQVGNSGEPRSLQDLSSRMESSFNGIGINLRERRGGRTPAQDFSITTRVETPPWMHISDSEVRFPTEEARHPFSAASEMNLLSYYVSLTYTNPIDTPLRGISLSHAHYVIDKADTNKPITDDNTYVSHEMGDYFKAASIALGYCIEKSLKFAISTFPLVRLSGAGIMCIAIYIEGSTADRRREEKYNSDLNSRVRNGFETAIQFDALLVRDLEDIRKIVPTVPTPFLESIFEVMASEAY
jgi:hypothetical protein